MNETVIRLPSGRSLCAPAYPSPCNYVRIINADGSEYVYWDSTEWEEDPEGVMGAIVGAMREDDDYDLSADDPGRGRPIKLIGRGLDAQGLLGKLKEAENNE